MSSRAPPKTTRSGREPKDSEKKKLMQETQAMESPPRPKRKRRGANKENLDASKKNTPEFKITPLATNSTSLKGAPVNLQARKIGLPIPRASTMPASKPANIIAGQRRPDLSATPSSRKLTKGKAAELAALRNPFGTAPSGRNGSRPSATSTPQHASQPVASSSGGTGQGAPRSRQSRVKPRYLSPAPFVESCSRVSRSEQPTTPRSVKALEHSVDDLYASDHAPDQVDAPYLTHIRVPQIRTEALEDDDCIEDKEAGIPCESWISSRLRERAKIAKVLLTAAVTDGEDDELADGHHTDTEEHELARGDIDVHSDEAYRSRHRDHANNWDELSQQDDQDELADVLREDEHDGEFDDAPDDDDDEEDGYDSDAPLAKQRRFATHVDSDPRSTYPKAARIRDRVEGKRPRIADYEADAQQILAAAIRIFKSLVSTEDAYPDKLTELVWAKQAWWEAADDLDVELAPNRECVKIITAYAWHLRGEMKTAARNLVETAYRFRPSGQTAIQLRNRERAAALRKNDTFVYYKRGKTTEDNEGLYQADIIQQMANRIYFKNKKDDGIMLKGKYSLFPVVAFALLLAAVECAIEEWSSGSFTKVPFTEERYAPIYRHHLRELRQYEAVSDDMQVVTQICQWIYEDGRIYAKAGPDETLVTRSLGAKVHAKALADFKRTGGRYDRASADDVEDDEN